MYTTLLAAMLASAPPSPPSGFAPTLYVRLIAPTGVTTTLRPGTAAARQYGGAADFAVRPGYSYRVALGNLPDDPSTTVYPTIEVRASLFLPMTLSPADFPATLRVDEEDLRRVLAGGLVTKVVYLENPETASPEHSTPDRPLEFPALRGDDPVEMAAKRGRPLMIVRLGSRSYSDMELQAEDIPGTLFQAGEPLTPPSAPPTLPARSFRLYDPIAGPKTPMEELLQDGGDVGPRIGVAPNGDIGNLDPTDSAVEYRFGRGPRRTMTSNRICLVAPRFAVIRHEIAIQGYATHTLPAAAESTAGLLLHRTRLPSEMFLNVVPPMAMIMPLGLRGIQSLEGVHELEQYRGGPIVMSRIDGTAVVTKGVELASFTQYRDFCRPDDPIVLVKSAEPREAKPGDVVTFSLKVINYGARSARDIVVADSLSPRLEYVPGSSRGDRPTVFTLQDNGAGSAVLRWELSGEIPAGQNGVVQFQARVK